MCYTTLFWKERGMTTKSWKVSDSFWSKVEPLIPKVNRDKTKAYQRRKGGGRKPMASRQIFWSNSLCFSDRNSKNMAVRAVFIVIFKEGERKAFFWNYGKKGLQNTMIWKESLGNGKASTAPWQKRLLLRNQLVPIPLIEEKNATKRHILVDEYGVPLSIVVTGANRHDVTQIESVLQNRIRKPRGRTKQNLCADAGYFGKKIEGNYASIPLRTAHPFSRRRKNCDTERIQSHRWIV